MFHCGNQCLNHLTIIHSSLYTILSGLPPTQDASHHQDYYISSRESQPKPSFGTVTLGGVDPDYSTTYQLWIPPWRSEGGHLIQNFAKHQFFRVYDMVGDVLSSGGDYALDIQTPVEKVFGPPKYVKNTFSGRGCFQKRGQLDGIF